MPLLQTNYISKSYSDHQVLSDINIHLDQGELVSILGISGIGKTTLFNIIAGLLSPESGQVILKDQPITNTTGQISYMLQKDLLLPYRTIMGNVILPALMQDISKKEAEAKAAPLFKLFGLQHTEKLYPQALSGGMRQRAALLRTYMFNKEVALLDEPFSALDEITKHQVHSWYLNLMKKINLSTLLITHDVEEAILLSDRIYLLTGTPATITQEISIDAGLKKQPDFELSTAFLNYKRKILSLL
ncbi:ABC transporter ATP-binding protein [Pediococcus ethanolidurans]|uniref:ABC-type nitrate/sulfonate/bicarbonate transport system, ATPase component n=1 Tax=Pediococcus ethanolidurans TaxID=319653 RepID=A0A0R2K8Y4_9LACO|nr:ABC transporter ATP-binding protein [Pediococcus ethanolidurans]KRN82701.1 peptide ABC transporter ATPase [Pediococcus ethanolidurans]GEN94940.1 nitrate ABC transporter ATP-binding protein [Pediococcus ethanolidurans]SER47771.1 ABC-type nitrate/sulfonate/bicarbonate transport system, ATPase component [Pediococcus ethanolidurans]